jgi:hypothetical protein
MIDTFPLITYIPMSEKLPDKIDLTRCMAFKSKTDRTQCPCRHRTGSRFCGKHFQTKQEILANGSRRSINRTLLASGTHTRQITKQTNPNNPKNSKNSNNPNNPNNPKKSNNPTNQTNQTNPTNPTNSNKSLQKQIKQITHASLCKDPYLTKLTSQQINDNFLFYKLNNYLPNKQSQQTRKQLSTSIIARQSHEITTENKRKLLIKLLNLLSRIDKIDPLHSKIIKLQRLIRKYRFKIRKWNRGAGALNPMTLCLNKDDFCSLDQLDTIPKRLLFTYRDEDGFVYGFNLLSFLELLSGCEQPLNPYNRKPISRDVIHRANKYYRILDSWSKIDENDVLAQQSAQSIQSNRHSIQPLLDGGQPTVRISLKERTKLRLQSVFQKINYLGYQTNTDWLLDKPVQILINFIKTMARNWSFQLGFSDATKQSLLAPADLLVFESLVNDSYHNQQLGYANTLLLMNRILAVLEPLINNPSDPNSAALLVLYSLYYIEPRRVSIANPWMA